MNKIEVISQYKIIMIEDLLKKIYSFTPYCEKYKLKFVSKTFNYLYKKEINIKSTKIQKFYKKNRLNKKYLNDPLETGTNSYLPPDHNIWNPKLLYRIYILEYPEEYLYIYPDFLVNKLYKNSNSQRAQQLKEWLDSNDILQKKSNVYRFFRENMITSQEIMTTGW